MKALVLDHPGSPREWQIRDIPTPLPLPGDVLVRVFGVGLNPADYKIAQWGNPAWKYPFVMGLDVAGVIEGLGEGVTNWKIGDKVYYHGDFTRPGGFAEYTTIPHHVIAPLPTNLSFNEAASVPCSGFAAYQGLFHKMHLNPGTTVLVQGGAGGVGSYAIQLATLAGAQVFTTASAQNAAYVKELGAHEVIDYRTENVHQRIMELTQGRGVEVIIDTVSQESTTAGLEMIAFGGHIICVDSLPDFSKVRPFAKAFSLHEIALGVAHLSGDREAQMELAEIGQKMGELLEQGKIRPTLNRVVALEDVPSALELIAQRHVRGKIVARLSNNQGEV